MTFPSKNASDYLTSALNYFQKKTCHVCHTVIKTHRTEYNSYYKVRTTIMKYVEGEEEENIYICCDCFRKLKRTTDRKKRSCYQCGENFTSRNKLFKHLRATEHFGLPC